MSARARKFDVPTSVRVMAALAEESSAFQFDAFPRGPLAVGARAADREPSALALADAQVETLIARRLDSDAIDQAAKALIAQRVPNGREVVRLAQTLDERADIPVKTRDAIGAIGWLHAESGFALGLALGLRIGGGR